MPSGTVAIPAILVSILACGCDQDYRGPAIDTLAELLPDMTGDATDPATDPADDPATEPADDPVTEPPTDLVVEDTGSECTYPTGPYAFSAVGNTVGPMRWPSAVAGPDETLTADLAVLHCDPGVKSIFVQIVTTT